jgi:hypothetical protein
MKFFTSARAVGFTTLVLASAAFAPPAKRVAGITFDAVTTSTVPVMGAGSGGVIAITMHGIAASDGATRMDVGDVQLPAGIPSLYAVGDYLLQADGHFVLVHPSSKTYVDMIDQASAALKNLPPQMLAEMTVTDIKGETTKLDDGEVIEGRATEHYTMAIMGQTLPSKVTTDYWVAKLPVKFSTPFTSSALPALASGPMGELMKKRAELTPAMGDGVPVKMVMATESQMMGQSMLQTVTSEIKNVEEGDIDASKFAIPTGYTKSAK